MSPAIREARPADDDAIWAILEPVSAPARPYPIRATFPHGCARLLAYAGHAVFVAEDDGTVVGTYYLARQ